MKTFAAILLFCTATIGFPMLAPGQAQSKAGTQNPDTIVIEKSEVVLDAVVRDKKGRPVTNLSARDFEIYEDGAPQQIASIRLVVRGSETAAPAPTNNSRDQNPRTAVSATPSDTRKVPVPAPENSLSAVALVFDRLSTDARARAHAAAIAYLGQGLSPNDLVGVFAVNPSLKVLQQFTNDKLLIKQAIDQAENLNSTTAALDPKQIDDSSNVHYLNDLWTRQAALAEKIYKTSTLPTDPSTNLLGDTARLLQLQMEIRMAEVFDGLERDRQGEGTTETLLAIIEALGKLPGRKAVVLFGASVSATAKVMPQFRNVITNANRAGVSIYAVDAAGLRTVSSDVEAGQAMTLLGQRRATIAASADDNGPAGDLRKPMTWDLERNEELVRRNPERILGALADETGGLLISGTNDPGTRLRQVNEDLHSYYLLSYSPKNQNYDGAYRQISVRVARTNMDVQARKGYYALRESYDSPVFDYEAPALAMLSGKAVTDAFQTHCAAFSFPEPARPALVPVAVEVPAGSITFFVDKLKTSYRSDFSIVVLIKNGSQRVVRKLSTHYGLTGPYDKLDAVLSGNILFYKETQLDPGHYTVASIVYDALSKQASTASGEVVVPFTDQTRLNLSSIVFVKNAERIPAADQAASRLFHFGEMLLYPNLGEPVSKSESEKLSLFLTVYTSRNDQPVRKLTLEIAQRGRVRDQVSYDLPAPDQTGRIQYANAISLDKLEPGQYELKATVSDGATKDTRSERFTVQP